MMRTGPTLLLALSLALFCFPARAEGALTLAQALATAGETHPDLELARADHAAALAERELAESRAGWHVNLEAGLRYGRPTFGPEYHNDNVIRVGARKSLYDFGRTRLNTQAADALVDAGASGLVEARAKRELQIMERFFEVLLADLQYTADNEFMAVAYVEFDHARQRLELGQIAPAELARLEHLYQEALLKRNASQSRQRAARARLANAMNRPGQLPVELADPEFKGNDRPLPEYESLLPLLLADNPRLKAQASLLAASRQRMEALRADKSPYLDVELEAGDYSRVSYTRDNVKGGLVLYWPIHQGGRVDAQVAREMAVFQRLQAETAKLEMELKQALLETWLEIDELKTTVRGVAKQYGTYRELALERARGLYEVELKADLGDSMAATMAAKLRERRTEYQLALALARLQALLGREPASMGEQMK